MEAVRVVLTAVGILVGVAALVVSVLAYRRAGRVERNSQRSTEIARDDVSWVCQSIDGGYRVSNNSQEHTAYRTVIELTVVQLDGQDSSVRLSSGTPQDVVPGASVTITPSVEHRQAIVDLGNPIDHSVRMKATRETEHGGQRTNNSSWVGMPVP